MTPLRDALTRYGVAALAVAAAVGLRLLLDPALGQRYPFATLFLAVLVAAWHGGFGPAVFACGLGAAVSALVLLQPRAVPDPGPAAEFGGLALYLAVSLGIAVLGGGMRAARLLAEATAGEFARQGDQLRTTLRSIGDGVAVTDAEGKVVSLNPVAEELTGWPEAEAAGRPLADVFRIVNEDTRAPVESPVDKVLREGVVVGLANHTVLIARDGKERPIDDSAAPVRGPAGELAGVVLVFRDIGERRRAEQAAARAEAKLRQALAAVRMFAWEWSLTDGTAFASDTVAGVLGLTPAEAADAARALDLVHPDDRPGFDALLAESVAAGRGYRTCVRTRRADTGEYRWIDTHASPVTAGPGGAVVGYAGVSRDVTAEREAGEAARRAEERFRLAAVAVSGLIYDADLRAGTVERTRGMEDLVGYRPDEVPETVDWWWDQIHPDDRAAATTATPRTLPGGALGFVTEYRVRHKGGHYLHVLDRSVVTRDAAGAVVRAVGCTQDITPIREAEAALREAARAKDEFIATLAHELRNPLAPVRSGLDALRAGGLPAHAAPTLDMMDRQLRHLVRLVDDLLDVNRIARDKIELRRERVDLARAAADAADAARPAAEASGHALEVALPAGPVWVDADPTRLAQVIGNLLTNAVKYTPPGGRVGLEVRADGDAAAVVRVRDTGVGLPADMLERVFEPFVQAGGGAGLSQGGLGIGLTLARRLVELHGGTLTAASDGPGRGTEFAARLPRAAEEGARAEGPGARGEPAGRSDPSPLTPRPSLRVVVADDSRDAADSLAVLLRLGGHEVRVAYDGRSALDAVRDYRPDVAVLDLGMPGLGGHEVARALRADAATRGVVLVAVTGWGSDEDRRRSREAGFDHHLTKPVDHADLERVFAGRA